MGSLHAGDRVNEVQFVEVGQAAAEKAPLLESSESATGRIEFSYVDAFVLGLVEGVTEYLPISSTGHLILVEDFLNVAKEGDLASKEALDAYLIIIQIGAILAVLFIYWRQVLTIILGCLGKSPEGLSLAKNLIIAFMPAAVIGLMIEDFIDEHLFGVFPVIGALIFGALLMFYAERWVKKSRRLSIMKDTPDYGPELHELQAFNALRIGIMQCFAMWPGMSRSMMTIVGGYFSGLSPAKSAEFSFLLGLITLSAASFWKIIHKGNVIMEVLPLWPAVFGIFVAMISAIIAVKFFVSYLSRNGLKVFAWYRLVISAILLFIYL